LQYINIIHRKRSVRPSPLNEFFDKLPHWFRGEFMRWAGHVERMGEGRGVHRVLVGKPEGKIPLGRPRRRWENIKMNLRKVGRGGDWSWLRRAADGGHL